MIAATLVRPQQIEIEKAPLPTLATTEVRIKLQGCGICASSLPLWEGREWFSYPSEPGSPGHEGWGIVDAVGDEVKDVKAGDRVAFLSYHAYAEYDKAPAHELVVLPKALADQPFPGEPLGCAMNIFERSRIAPGETVAIIGSGFLGTLLCQLVKQAGAKVIAVSRRQFSLDFARRSGADELVPLRETWEAAGKVAEITGKVGCHCVIEATGKQQGIDVATEIVAEGGRIIVAGYHQDGLRQVNLQQWNWKGIDVINAHERAPQKYIEGMKKAVDAVLNGRINPDELYTELLPLDQLNKGFRLTADRPEGFMKALVTIS